MDRLERKVYLDGGTISGTGEGVGETTVDVKWRIVIPPDIREGLQKGQAIRVQKEGGRITIRPSVDLEKFELELKGCVKGSKIPARKLKEIWGTSHDHG
jgi:bifunctional DNA-binding transcriptional regulator/antitoxin component of YhaV-PrlF toxin-antitoxin module